MANIIRVCVIGAGAGGLCALRHLAARPDKFSVVAFEQTAQVGGTWVYNENTGVDQHRLPIHSSMYRNLRTNLPKEVMAFPDFPFDPLLPSFLTHQQVRDYLEDYTDFFKIRQHIRFNNIVENVSRVSDDNGGYIWKVKVKPVSGGAEVEADYDAVLVCNGHFSVPLIPCIEGLEDFKGKWIHSHDYRHPEPYRDQTVLVLGAASSGTDIALDIAPFAKQVYLSHNSEPLTARLPENVQQTAGLQKVQETGNLVLQDSSVLTCLDVIIFCTGYHFRFPFLGDALLHVDSEEHVTPLYKHLFHVNHPSLAFIGIPKKICPFPQFDLQARLYASVLSGETRLPGEAERAEEARREFEARLRDGLPERYAHTMGARQWSYNDELADTGRLARLPRVVKSLYNEVHRARAADLLSYKDREYRLLEWEEFQHLGVPGIKNQ